MEISINTRELHKLIKLQDKIHTEFKKKDRRLKFTADQYGLAVSFEDEMFKLTADDVSAEVLEEGSIEIYTDDIRNLPEGIRIAIRDDSLYGGGVSKILRLLKSTQFYTPCTEDEHLETYKIDNSKFFKCLERVKYASKKFEPIGQFVRFSLEGYMYSLDAHRISWIEGAGYMHDAVIPGNALDFLEQVKKETVFIYKNTNSLAIEVPDLKITAEFKILTDYKAKTKEFDRILDNFVDKDKDMVWETELKAKALITSLKSFDTKDYNENTVCIDTTEDTLKIEQKHTRMATQLNTVSRIHNKDHKTKIHVKPCLLKQALDSYKKLERVDNTVYANIKNYGMLQHILLKQNVPELDVKAYDLILPVRTANNGN